MSTDGICVDHRWNDCAFSSLGKRFESKSIGGERGSEHGPLCFLLVVFPCKVVDEDVGGLDEDAGVGVLLQRFEAV